MREIVASTADKLSTDLKETMVKCFDLGVIDEKKRFIERLKKVNGSALATKIIAELESELKEIAGRIQ